MSKTYFISRHAGAHAWADRQGFVAEVVQHFDPAVVQPGDVVLGTLPVHLAAEVCENGGRYFHLEMDVPASLRGQELSADDMENLGASLTEFFVVRAEFVSEITDFGTGVKSTFFPAICPVKEVSSGN